MAMKTSREGLIEIASHEGIVLSPYRDSKGIWTVFIGHTAGAGAPYPAKMAKGVARPIAEAMEVFARDVAKFEARVNHAFKVSLKQHEFDASNSFDYNTGAIDRASWAKDINSGNRAAAKKAFMRWRKPPEIIPRRQKECDLFFKGRYSNHGYANAYPASASGRVLWGKGKRVDISRLMNLPAGPERPADDLDAMADGILERGERGPAVMQLIKDLIVLDFYRGKEDSIFGSKTEAAVRSLQKKYDLKVDGRAGPKTFAVVEDLLEGNPVSATLPAVPPTNSDAGGIIAAIIKLFALLFGGKSK